MFRKRLPPKPNPSEPRQRLPDDSPRERPLLALPPDPVSVQEEEELDLQLLEDDELFGYWRLFGFQRGVTVASSAQLGLPA